MRVEPGTTAGAAGVAAWKAIGELSIVGAVGAGLAALVVMCVTTPRSAREWAVGLTSTVIASIGGGAVAIEYFGLEHWVYSPIGLVGMLGLVFACGLPGWAIVRWAFNYIARRADATLLDVAGDAHQLIHGGHQNEDS